MGGWFVILKGMKLIINKQKLQQAYNAQRSQKVSRLLGLVNKHIY